MRVMPGNHSSPLIHYWAGKYPEKLGWLFGPSAVDKTKIRDWLPFALDNDAFTAWVKNKPWDQSAWESMIAKIKMSGKTPLWAIVPDVVSDKHATIENWDKYKGTISKHKWPLAFAVQDGMDERDVPADADVVFVGGTTEWKWKTVDQWAKSFRRVHVGRVNSLEKIMFCESLGIESVDGTGWMRGTIEHSQQGKDLKQWIEGNAKNNQLSLF